MIPEDPDSGCSNFPFLLPWIALDFLSYFQPFLGCFYID